MKGYVDVESKETNPVWFRRIGKEQRIFDGQILRLLFTQNGIYAPNLRYAQQNAKDYAENPR